LRTVVSERDHLLTVVSPNDYLPCNFEALQNHLRCTAPWTLTHSWQEADFLMPSINVFGSLLIYINKIACARSLP
jgi:hypothetical protein